MPTPSFQQNLEVLYSHHQRAGATRVAPPYLTMLHEQWYEQRFWLQQPLPSLPANSTLLSLPANSMLPTEQPQQLPQQTSTTPRQQDFASAQPQQEPTASTQQQGYNAPQLQQESSNASPGSSQPETDTA